MADNSLLESSVVEVRYFAAAADAAGCESETLTVPDGADLAYLQRVLSGTHGPKLAAILDVSAFLLGDQLTRDRSLSVGSRVDVLPPFAGG